MTPSIVLALVAQLAAQAVGPVTLTARLADGRGRFRPGEPISLTLEFNSATPKRFAVDGATYDRSGRLTIDDIVIDRIDDVSDPLLDYFASTGGSIGGGIRGIGVLGEQPFTVTFDLNDRYRFDKPGPYTIVVRSHRVSDESTSPPAVMTVESNAVSLEILPRDDAWETSQLETARRIVDAKEGPEGGRAGCRMMRYLATTAAAMEMLGRYGNGANQSCDFDYMAGLFGAEDRAAVVRAMEARLRAPDQPVTSGYVRTLAALSVYVQHPELRPVQTRENKGRLVFGDSRPAFDLIAAAMRTYQDAVAAALPDKTDRARAITLADMPASGQLAGVFTSLPRERQTSLLAYQWRTVAGPAMLPALRQLVAAPPSEYESLPDLALRRLAQLSPDEARPLLLRAIQHPPPGSTIKTLGALPEPELPELDDVLAANVERSTTDIHAALVQRYATSRIAPRVLASVNDTIGRMACRPQASILAYFLRVDEVLGTALLDRAAGSRVTGCWQVLLTDVAELRMTPALEKRAVADLDSDEPTIVIAAIKALGAHGSPAALAPLRAAFQRWHAAWANRAGELAYSRTVERPNAPQAMVEDAFRQAIGAGQGWLMRAPDLRDLQSLCVTDSCRQQTQYMIDSDGSRIGLWNVDGTESNIELAQYHFTSLRALEDMLARYPPGSAFVIVRNGGPPADDVTRAVAELTTFAASHGLTIKER